MSVTNSMYSALQGTSVLTRSEAAVEPRPVSALSAQLMQMQHHTINFGNAADRIDSLISRLSPVPSEAAAMLSASTRAR